MEDVQNDQDSTSENEDALLHDKSLEEQEAADADALQVHIDKCRKISAHSSPSNQDGYGSDQTQTQGNGRSRTFAEFAGSRKSVTGGLDGYSRTPSKHVLFCKAKILVPESETLTAKTRSTFGMILTTLLKVDTSVKFYLYKDEKNRTFINNPTQIPEAQRLRVLRYGRNSK